MKFHFDRDTQSSSSLVSAITKQSDFDQGAAILFHYVDNSLNIVSKVDMLRNDFSSAL